MTTKEIVITDELQLPMVADELLLFSENQKIICFDAPMGAGKTTFIKAICKKLNYDGVVNSPTYTIINIYSASKNIYHIDCYRLKDVDEATAIGMEDYLFSDSYCFIEWASIIKKILPSELIEVHIEIIDATSRKFIFRKN